MVGPVTIACPLQELAKRQPAGVFLSAPSGDLTFQEVHEKVSAAQEMVRDLPLVICGSSSRDEVSMIIQLLACLREGVPLVLQNCRLPVKTLKDQAVWVRECISNCQVFAMAHEKGWRKNLPATVLFTSGSTGESRGIVHTLGQHWASAQAANQFAHLDPGDRWLCQLPLYHVGGLAIFFRCLEAGATLCFSEASSLSQAVSQTGATHLSLVPTQLIRWMEESDFDTEGVKRVLMGGAPLPGDVRTRALECGLPLATSYGMTETASQVTATPPGQSPVGSGIPLPHAQIRFSEEGEILVKAESTALGMLVQTGLEPLTDESGWFHTRDLGHLDEGVLVVDGRMDLQFISGGENIQPEVIERALTALEAITEAVVVPKEDPEFGHRPLAWVDVEVTGTHTRQWNEALRQTLPGYMIPVEYRTLPPLEGLKRKRGDYLV